MLENSECILHECSNCGCKSIYFPALYVMLITVATHEGESIAKNSLETSFLGLVVFLIVQTKITKLGTVGPAHALLLALISSTMEP